MKKSKKEIPLYELTELIPPEIMIHFFNEYYNGNGWMILGKDTSKKELKYNYGDDIFSHPLCNIKKGRLDADGIYFYNQRSLFISDWHFRKLNDLRGFLKDNQFLDATLEEIENLYEFCYLNEEQQNAIRLFFEVY